MNSGSDETAERQIDVFNQAKVLPTREQRERFLAEACGTDADLRAQVEELLRAHDEAGSFLNGGQGAHATLPAEVPAYFKSEEPGDRIGHYKLLQQIGEGGFGTVWMAEQTEPMKRRVALKIIKLGMDIKEVIARFEQERQALAMMDHPNIARVLDAGATPTGRPFFVMELVRGIKITDYCDKANLSTEERLILFLSVCHAVQHAHHKGIIHRDLKPSNILVTLHDGVAVPKVIDFGVAKATQEVQLTERTLFTQFQQMIGTPLYMSPEQAEMSGLDIDTRSDIYSLGVLLYELLVGRTPFDPEKLLKAGYDEMRRVIREEEPPKPSTALSTMQVDLRCTVAQHRRCEAARFVTVLRGDLDWIVMKALEKDRTRRYATANAFAEDIRHYLGDEPVSAARPSPGYRFRKFARRNKTALSVIAMVAAILVIATVASVRQALRATTAQDLANKRLSEVATERDEKEKARQQAEANRQQAEREAIKSEQVAALLKDMLQSVQPKVALGRDTTLLREILDRTAERVSKDLKDQPEVSAELCSILGETYLRLGESDKAVAMQRNALRIRMTLFGEEDLRVAASLHQLASALISRGAGADSLEAENCARRALAVRRQLLPPTHSAIADSLKNMARTLESNDKIVEAEKYDREALQILRETGAGPEAIAHTLQGLGQNLRKQAKLEQAEVMLRQALEMRKAHLGELHPDYAYTLGQLGLLLTQQGSPQGEGVLREAVQLQTQVLGGTHRDTQSTMVLLCRALTRSERFSEAESIARKVFELRRQQLGPDHESTRFAQDGLLHLLRVQDRLQLEEAKQREALNVRRNAIGRDDPEVAHMVTELAFNIWYQGRIADAEEAFRGRLEMWRRIGATQTVSAGAYASGLANALSDLARIVRSQGRRDEAAVLYREEVATWKRVFGPVHREVGNGLFDLAEALSGQTEEEAVRREELEIERSLSRPDHPNVANSLNNVAAMLVRQGRHQEAEPLLREALDIRRKTFGNEGPQTIRTMLLLAANLQHLNRQVEADALFRDAAANLEQLMQRPPLLDNLFANELAGLTVVLLEQQKYVEAEPVARQSLAIREKTALDNWVTFHSRVMIGRSLLGQKRYAEAELLLISGYEGMKARESNLPIYALPRLRETLQAICNLYEATGEADKAAEWNEKLGSGRANLPRPQAQPPK